jgi:hypothetical protein
VTSDGTIHPAVLQSRRPRMELELAEADELIGVDDLVQIALDHHAPP